jgi:hypothetical protein
MASRWALKAGGLLNRQSPAHHLAGNLTASREATFSAHTVRTRSGIEALPASKLNLASGRERTASLPSPLAAMI